MLHCRKEKTPLGAGIYWTLIHYSMNKTPTKPIQEYSWPLSLWIQMSTSQSSLPHKEAEGRATGVAANMHHQRALRDNSASAWPEWNSFHKQTACSGFDSIGPWSIAHVDVMTMSTWWHKCLTEDELSLSHFTNLLWMYVIFIIIYSHLVPLF